MKLEAERGSLHKARAEQKFIAAVQDSLPVEAFKEIEAAAIGEELAWARKWGVNAPCIMEIVGMWRDGLRIALYRAPAIPTTWRQAISEMNGRPVATQRHLPSKDVASKEEQQRERAAWAEEHPWSTYAAEQLRLTLPDLDGLRGINRDEQREHDLSPIASDPATESLDGFCGRARLHWEARAEAAKNHGLQRALDDTKWREFARDLKWLIRYQVYGEAFGTIAEDSESGHVGGEAVRKAVRRLATILNLEYRAGRRGGRRRRR